MLDLPLDFANAVCLKPEDFRIADPAIIFLHTSYPLHLAPVAATIRFRKKLPNANRAALGDDFHICYCTEKSEPF
jgi:hypothetical protein